jgi:predicted dehydrogenase
MEFNKQAIRWGILGCGRIAHKLVNSSKEVDGCEIVAAASNTPGKAAAFCNELNIGQAYDGYEKLLADADIDVIYVANTHNYHMETTLAALDAGKAVLCEKPLAINAAQARRMVEKSREKGLFLMEAMWTRFLPAHVQARQWLSEGSIGNVVQIHASFGFPLMHVERLTKPDLAGGALLDLGIYPLSFASGIMGGRKPEHVNSLATIIDTGVDGSAMIQYDYGDGVFADLKFSMQHGLPNEGWIIGTKGRIHFSADFHSAQAVRLITPEGTQAKSFEEDESRTFKYQIMEVNRCVQEGRLESDVMPLNESVSILESMDAFRQEWGVCYPGE